MQTQDSETKIVKQYIDNCFTKLNNILKETL